MGNLDGKVALVTGAGGMKGVGRATALKLSGQGADLAITDVRRDASDLPPAEVRQEWHSIDSVSDEIEDLGHRCLPRFLPDLASRRINGREEESMSFVQGAITRGLGEGVGMWVPGHHVLCKANGEETGGAYSLLEVTITGEGPPQHIHKAEDEAFYVLEGVVNFRRGEETVQATAGAFVLIPRGTNHTVWNAGSTPAKLLAIFSPPGVEHYFVETGDADKEPETNAYIEKAMAVADKYNLEITGPPLG